MRAPLKKIFLARYVLLCEIAGYGIAFILLGLWILFFFIRKDEYCFSPGNIKPATILISLENRAVLKTTEAKNGEWVEKGQLLFSLNTDTKAIAARQAQADLSSLGDQIITLATSTSDRETIQKSVSEVVTEVGQLETGNSPLEIRATEAGLLHYTIASTSTASNPVVSGQLAQIISDKIMRFEGDMGELNRHRVTVGMPAKIEMKFDQTQIEKGLGGRIADGFKKAWKKILRKEDEKVYRVMGKVAQLPGGTKVIIEAPVTNARIGKLLTDQIQRPEKTESQLKAEARVIVGNVRLVTYLFKRSESAPKKETKAENKESFIKRTWHKFFPAKAES